MPTLSVVTVSWNSAEHLGTAIASIRDSALLARTTIEIIVVDNASRDGSADVATEAGADRIVRNRFNVGFAVAANQGAALASAPWLMMMNPDLRVSDTFLGATLERARSDSATGSVIPDVRFEGDPTVINHRGLAIDSLGRPFEIQSGERARDIVVAPMPIAGSGGASLVSRTAFCRASGFDPVFFAYVEDADLGWRLTRMGFMTLYAPLARASHIGSSTVGIDSRLQLELVARNRTILFLKTGPHPLRRWLRWIASETLHSCFLTLINRTSSPLRGRVEGGARAPYALFRRASEHETIGGSAFRLTTKAPRSLSHSLGRKLSARARHRRRGGGDV